MSELKVELLAYTPAPDIQVARAARLCYYGYDIAKLKEVMTPEKSAELVEKLTSMGHASPIEHAVFTFGIEGVSRALTHQLVRHRIASYSQQSQRYVNGKQFGYIIPPAIEANPNLKVAYENFMKECQTMYEALVSNGIEKEDARMVLPNGCDTKIIVTMNARSLMNFFQHRCCNRAQWEIRRLAWKMLRLCKEVAPELFKHAGPDCWTCNRCNEEDMSCKRPYNYKNEKYVSDFDTESRQGY